MRKFNYLIFVAMLLALVVIVGNSAGFMTNPIISTVLLVIAGVCLLVYLILDIKRRNKK